MRKPKIRWSPLTADESERVQDLGQELSRPETLRAAPDGSLWSQTEHLRAWRSQDTSGVPHGD